MLVRFAIIEEAVAGGVDDREPEAVAPPTSWVMIEGSRRVEPLSGLTVLMEGEGGVAVSEDTVVGTVTPRFRARYDR
jgi:hypothetical protein